MIYELHRHVPLAEEARRLVLGQIQAASRSLRDDDVVEGVHEARKALKRARAALRAFRDLFRSDFASVNEALGLQARRLSALRDQHALVDALDGLAERHPMFAETTQTLRELFAAPAAPNADRALADDVAMALEIEGKRVLELEIEGDAVAALTRGLRRSYRDARRAMRDAYAEPTTDRFHAWRRRAKDVTHHWMLLSPIWPDVLSGYVASAKQLGDALGDDHDAALLSRVIMNDTRITAPTHTRAEWIELLEDARGGLRTRARHLGRRLFAETPRQYVDRLQAWLCAWQDEDRQPPKS